MLFLALMTLAQGGAEFKMLMAKGGGPSGGLYRVIFTIWVAIALLTPSQSGGGPGQVYVLSRGWVSVGCCPCCAAAA